MTQTRLQAIPLLYFLVLAAGSYLAGFNGLYGQDAHEYLRQAGVFFQRLQGEPVPAGGLGEAELAGGYPLFGALIMFLGLPAGLAVQTVSLLAAGAALWLFERNLRLLSPGAHPKSRWLFTAVGLGLAPVFVRAGLTAMSDAPGLAFMLAALYFGLGSLEQDRRRAVFGFAIFSVFAVSTRFALAALLALPALTLALERYRMRRLAGLGLGILAGLLAAAPFWWLKTSAPGSVFGHSLLQDWSVFNLFKKTFAQASGTVSYTVPNIVYLLFPVMHPGFCLTLPGLFLLFKQTDIRLYSKRLLALSLFVYLFFLGGIPHQNLRYLLPAYAVFLLLLFPAWDRFFAYGLYFFKRLTHALVGLTVVVQLFYCFIQLKPVWTRNQVEREMAGALKTELRAGAVVYAFDVDIALQTYLPEIEFRNMWVQRYDSFPDGSFMVFNAPKLRDQWAGQPPMLNWERANASCTLQAVRQLPEGWTLYRIDAAK